MKKFINFLILTICIIIINTSVFASDVENDFDFSDLYDTTTQNEIIINPIKVKLNESYIDFTDENGNVVEPQIINSRTMVPMRKIFEVLGAEINWDGETRTVTGTKDNVTIVLQIDNLNAQKIVDGEQTNITLDSAPVIINSRTMVPVRFIAESLDKMVGWDDYNKAVIILDTSFVENTLKSEASNFYEYLTTDFEEISSYAISTSLNGTLNYEDKENRKNNTSLKLTGSMTTKFYNDLFSVDANLAVSGQGLLNDEVKNLKLNKIVINLILDMEDDALYIKTSTSNEFKNKWLKYELNGIGTELKNLINIFSNNIGVQGLIDSFVQEDNLSITSYEELNALLNIITSYMNNDKFIVSGRTSKTYKFNIDYSDIINLLGSDFENIENPTKINLNTEVKVSDGLTKESKYNILFETTLGEEKVNVDFEMDSKLNSYNKPVEIKLPKNSEVTVRSFEDILN